MSSPPPPSGGKLVHIGKAGKVNHFKRLDDGTIGYILSLLPMREAIQTVVLGKEWKEKWMEIFKVDFVDDEQGDDNLTFSTFVDSYLQRTIGRSLKSAHMTLNLNLPIYTENVPRWIAGLTCKTLEVLCLWSYDINAPLYKTSFALFELLHELVLYSNCELHIPLNLNFTNLRSLFLTGRIQFCNNDGVTSLSIAFPVLKEMVMTDCEWLKMRSVILYANELSTLEVSTADLRTSKADTDGKLTVVAPQLDVLKIHGTFSEWLLLESAPRQLASFVGGPCEQRNIFIHRSVSLLFSIRSVTTIHLSHSFVKDIVDAKKFPSMVNVKTLTFTCNFSYKMLLDLLNYFPNVESLSVILFRMGDEIYEPPSLIPQCFTSLENVTFLKFQGHVNDLGLISSIFRNAPVIKKVTVFPIRRTPEDESQLKELSVSLQLLSLGLEEVSCLNEHGLHQWKRNNAKDFD